LIYDADFLSKNERAQARCLCGGSSSLRGEAVKVEDGVLHLKDENDKTCYVAIEKIVVVWDARATTTGRDLCQALSIQNSNDADDRKRPAPLSWRRPFLFNVNVVVRCARKTNSLHYNSIRPYVEAAAPPAALGEKPSDMLAPVTTKVRIDNAVVPRGV